MNTHKRACKIARLRVLLSALEEARKIIGDTPHELSNSRTFLLAKLDQEIEWVKIRIKRLEERK